MIVIVGAGIGGLLVAAILGKLFRKKVCVLEAHTEIGGCLHTFKQRGYEFDVGLHYVGGMRSSLGRFVSALSGTSWVQIPGPHDVLILPTRERIAFGQRDEQFRVLCEQASRPFAEKYFRLVCRTQASMKVYYVLRLFFPTLVLRFCCTLLCPLASEMMHRSAADVLMEAGADGRTVAICTYHWADFGAPPQQLSFAAHAMLVSHWWDGNFYPVGGPKAIAQGLRAAIRGSGGEVRLGQRVVQRSGNCVTIAGARGSGTTLAFDGIVYACGLRAASKFAGFECPPADESFFVTYVALDATAAALELPTFNTWIMSGSMDHDQNMVDWKSGALAAPPMAFVSFNCAKDPSARDVAKATAAIVCPVSGGWSRDRAYEERKKSVESTLCDLMYSAFPALASHEVFRFSGTPITFDDYLGTVDGCIYGRKKRGDLCLRAPDGALITGSDVVSAGIGGACVGAVLTCQQMLGCRGIQLLLRL